jgi:hypothetical protein
VPDQRWRHAFPYGDNSFFMANITSRLRAYGENCFAMANINPAVTSHMAEISLSADIV